MNVNKSCLEIPLCVLGLFCFLTIFMSQTRFIIAEKPEKAPFTERQHAWKVWSFKRPNICGLFLKAVIMVSSPFLSLVSTLLLLAGVSKRNLYLFLPWLLLTFRSLLAIQSLNLFEIFHLFLENRRLSETVDGDWKLFCLYLVLVIFDAAECFCFLEIFRMFVGLWRKEPDSEKEKEPEDKDSVCEDQNSQISLES